MPSLYDDTIFEYYEKLEQNSIKKLDILLEKYHLKLDAYKDYFSRGSFNNTFSVKVDKEGDPMHNKNVLIRKGKDTYGKFDNNGNAIVHKDGDITLNQIKRNESNWFQCNLKAICPKIYYYGYFKDIVSVNDDDSIIYPIMITEKYDSDLSNFLYHNNKELSTNNQESIANQLEYLFKTLISLEIICYDIKPENTVIRKNDDGTLDVRLIDLDGDYCLSYKKDNAYPPLKTDEQKELLLILSLIFYGNYLFFWNKNNILNNKIQHLLDNYNREYKNNPYESLKEIFKKNQNNNNNYSGGKDQFNFFSKHYFNSKLSQKLKHVINDPEKLFDILFDNAVFKNEITKKLEEKKNKIKRKRRSRIQPAGPEVSTKEPLTVEEMRNMMIAPNMREGGKRISKCKKITTKKKYTTRKSPPYSASKCARGTIKKGNDGKMYIVNSTSKGVNRWLPMVSKKTKKSKK